MAAHGDGERVEVDDVSVLTGIESWRVRQALQDLRGHGEVDGLDVPGMARLTTAGRGLATTLAAERPQFASLVSTIRDRADRTRLVRSGSLPPLEDDERAFLAAVGTGDPLAYEPWPGPAGRADLAADPARAKAAYRGLVAKDLLSADPADPDQLRPTLPGLDVARKLATAADLRHAEAPATAPDAAAVDQPRARETRWQQVVRVTNHQVVGALTAEAIKKIAAVVALLVVVACVWFGFVGRESKLARWARGLVTDEPTPAAGSEVVGAAAAPAGPGPSTARGEAPAPARAADAELSPPVSLATVPAAGTTSLVPPSAGKPTTAPGDATKQPGTLVGEIRVEPHPQPGQDSRASENFALRPPAGARQFVWVVSGAGDGSPRIRFGVSEDVQARDGPRSLSLGDLRDIGRDRPILPDLRDGSVTDALTKDRVYIGGVEGATEPFIVRVYAR